MFLIFHKEQCIREQSILRELFTAVFEVLILLITFPGDGDNIL